MEGKISQIEQSIVGPLKTKDGFSFLFYENNFKFNN
jgi:hypothetical protein